MKRPADTQPSSPEKRGEKSIHIYMCRHGTTTWNLAKRWQGEQDTELAPEGIAQAEATGKTLAARISSCSGIYTSDLKRAKATAEIYAKELACDVTVEPRLREPSLGKFEGMVKSDIYSQYADLFKRMAELSQVERLDEAYFEGLETPAQTSSRAEAAAADVFRDLPDGATVLFVTHSKVLEAVLAKVFNKFYEGVETTPGAFFHWTYRAASNELTHLHKIDCHDFQVEQ
ncbi:gpmB [Symbiodinium natans]|uniref:GpmB protein n=1 Tax=Symbiodinium natans TaxID=878477 RepID=A0A812LGP2_9DINO|nr:gpmB [Symbiodinium natans]